MTVHPIRLARGIPLCESAVRVVPGPPGLAPSERVTEPHHVRDSLGSAIRAIARAGIETRLVDIDVFCAFPLDRPRAAALDWKVACHV